MKLLITLNVLILALLLLSFGCHHATEPPLPTPPDTTSHEITWTSTTLGDFSSHLIAVWGKSANSVWAVGQVAYLHDTQAAYVVHYDGTSWQEIRHDSLSLWVGNGILSAIHGTSDSSWVTVGGYEFSDVNNNRSNRTVAIFWDGHRWQNLHLSAQHILLSVWMVSRTDIYAGGTEGCLFHFDGTGWQELSSPTTLAVQGIFGLPTGEIYAVACNSLNSLTGSMILRLDGLNPRQEQFVSGWRLFSIWGDKTTAYVTGEETYRRSNSATNWALIDRPLPWATLHSVTGTKASDILVAGSSGIVHHWNGVSWRFYDQLAGPANSKIYYGALAIAGKYFLVGYNGFNAELNVGLVAGN